MNNGNTGGQTADRAVEKSELEQLEAFKAQYAVIGNTTSRQSKTKKGADGTEISDGIVNAMIDDLRRHRLEKWCRKHGKKVKFELKDKIALRKWFYSLDSDGSGEVSTEELHDPMISTGILKTKQQVFNTIRSIDTSKVSVDFDTFSKAIYHGTVADQTKLKKLQGFCENVHGFNVDTLFSMERRKLLLSTIMDENRSRQDQIDTVLNKQISHDAKLVEMRLLEDSHANSIVDHDDYIEELQEALQLNKKDHILKEAARQKDIETLARLKERQQKKGTCLPGLSNARKLTPGTNYRRNAVLHQGEGKLPIVHNLSGSKSASLIATTTSVNYSSGPLTMNGGNYEV